MLSLKMKKLIGLNNDILDQQSRGYFTDIFRRCFTVVFLIISKNFEKFTTTYMRQVFFVKITSLTLLKTNSLSQVFFCIYCSILKNNSFLKHIGMGAAKKISDTPI